MKAYRGFTPRPGEPDTMTAGARSGSKPRLVPTKQESPKHMPTDTSAERLDEIKRFAETGKYFARDEGLPIMLDLLAMIDERDKIIRDIPIGWTHEEVSKLLVERDQLRQTMTKLGQIMRVVLATAEE